MEFELIAVEKNIVFNYLHNQRLRILATNAIGI